MALHNTISTVPSEAIHQALDDLIELSRTPGCKIDMGCWLLTDPDTHVCSMCLGGAVMASIIDASPKHHYLLEEAPRPTMMVDVGLLTDKQVDMIRAMDDIRSDDTGTVIEGLDAMGVPVSIALTAIGGISFTDYENDPELFIGERRTLANALKAQGY